MTSDELDRSLRHLRLGGIADSLSLRAQQARSDTLGPLDFLGLLVTDELQRRRDRLVERRIKAAGFRDRKTLDTFNWNFNQIDRTLIFELATGRFIEQHDDVLIQSRRRGPDLQCRRTERAERVLHSGCTCSAHPLAATRDGSRLRTSPEGSSTDR
jgi:hypothetical protein